MKTCSIEGCGRDGKLTRGWCGTHYKRWRVHGDPLWERMRQVGCNVEDCRRPHYGRGWCSMHWKRWRRHGSVDFLGRETYPTFEEAFTRRTKRGLDTRCLLWTGPVAGAGYGALYVKNDMKYAHRYAWERANGPIPEGMYLDHLCHTPLCCEVTHLRIATPAENNWHRSGAPSHNTSGHRNVNWDARANKWEVSLFKKGEKSHYGYFTDLDEAAEVARKAREELFGEFAGEG